MALHFYFSLTLISVTSFSTTPKPLMFWAIQEKHKQDIDDDQFNGLTSESHLIGHYRVASITCYVQPKQPHIPLPIIYYHPRTVIMPEFTLNAILCRLI